MESKENVYINLKNKTKKKNTLSQIVVTMWPKIAKKTHFQKPPAPANSPTLVRFREILQFRRIVNVNLIAVNLCVMWFS